MTKTTSSFILDSPKVDQIVEMDEKVAQLEKTVQDLSSRVKELEWRNFSTAVDTPAVPQSKRGVNEFIADHIDSVVGLKEALTWRHRPLKVIWICLLLGGFTATVFYIYKNTEEFLNKDLATKITLEKSSTYALPPLIVCPPWPFDVGQLRSRGLTDDGLLYSLGYSRLYRTYFDTSKTGPLAKDGVLVMRGEMEANETQLHRIITNGRPQFLDFYRKENFSMLLDYYKNIMDELIEDSDGNSSSSVVLIDGCNGCLLDENGTTSTVSLTKPIRTPTKRIYPQALCYSIDASPMDAESVNSPFQIRLTNEDRTEGLISPYGYWTIDFAPSVGTSGPSILLEPSMYSIKLNAQRIIMIKNESTCVDNMEAERTGYTQPSCVTRCVNEASFRLGAKHTRLMENDGPEQVANSLSLIDSGLSFYSTTHLYNDTMAWANYTGLNTTAFSNPTSAANTMTTCHAQCLPLCDRFVYDVTVMNTGRDDHRVKNISTIQLEVKHAAMYQGGIITWQEIDTKTFSDFISNVGGTFGLFLGCTAMTLAQLILSTVNYALETRNKKCNG